MYIIGTLLGANAGESLQNLYDWLDTIILPFCTDDVLVYRCDGTRMWGWYRGIVGKSQYKQLLTSLSVWGMIVFPREEVVAQCFN